MSSVSLNLMFAATFFAFILLVNGNPIDSNEKYDIVVCPEGAQAQNGLIDGVVIYPREERCARIGGMCVEKDKCRSLVSANGLCPNNQAKGVECCFELEPQYLPCHQL
ncbi:hypothetical protein PVAND_008734 [Polypedilum vanderplanki]|uniref:Uncharacterized protein n=1 Tax=Polypedilum vanderplanki TaxID=319348 RepID=A0A9J6CAW3_POLVA|nr:hypothetical protein PVAND_008734 [Polypedilum vanderplanki]